MIVDRLGTRPASNKIDAITQLSRPNTVEEVPVLLGMIGYLRRFEPQYSKVLAPISDLLRDPRFRTKRAKKEKVPWGEEQNKAFNALIEVLTSPPILALPVWTEPFSLSTDASEIGAEAVLTQCIEEVDKVIAYGSKRWSRGDSKRSATARECMAVMWAVSKFQPYLWGRRFPLITDCSALTCLFKSQSHTEIPPLGSKVDGARHNLEVKAGDTTPAPRCHVAVTEQEQRDRRFRRLFSRRRVVAKRLQMATGASARWRTPRNLKSGRCERI